MSAAAEDVIMLLRRAHKLISGGWHPWFCLTGDGKICPPTADGAARFDLHGALEEASHRLWSCSCNGDISKDCRRCETWLDAEALLQSIANPSGGTTLWRWEQMPERTMADVRALIDQAFAKSEARRRREVQTFALGGTR